MSPTTFDLDKRLLGTVDGRQVFLVNGDYVKATYEMDFQWNAWVKEAKDWQQKCKDKQESLLEPAESTLAWSPAFRMGLKRSEQAEV